MLRFQDVNSKFINAQQISLESSISIHTFSDKFGNDVAQSVRKVFDNSDLSSDKFKDFRKLLASIYNSARSLFATQLNWMKTWGEFTESLIEMRESLMKGYLSGDAQIELQRLIENIQSFSQSKSLLAENLIGILDSQPKSHIVLDPKLSDFYSIYNDFLVERGYKEVRMHAGVKSLFAETLEPMTNLIFISPLSGLSEKQLRTLLVGGSASSIKILNPVWQSAQTRRLLTTPLYPGLGQNEIKYSEVKSEELEIENEPDFDEQVFSGPVFDFEDVEVLTVLEDSDDSGVMCRIARLAGGYALPVELSASKLTVLEESEDGTLKVARREVEDLVQGDLVVEMVGSNAAQYLWDASSVKLGPALWGEFLSSRKLWREILAKKVRVYGQQTIIRDYKKSGISAAEQIPEWLGNETFVRPRSNKDFSKLISMLGLSEQDGLKVIKLADKVKGERNAIAKELNSSLPNEIEMDQVDAANKGEPVFIEIEVSGGAKYLISRFEMFEDKTLKCLPSQVRRVTRRKNG